MKAAGITTTAAVADGLAMAPSALAIGTSDFVVNIPYRPTPMSPPARVTRAHNCDRLLPTAGGGSLSSGTGTCRGS